MEQNYMVRFSKKKHIVVWLKMTNLNTQQKKQQNYFVGFGKNVTMKISRR